MDHSHNCRDQMTALVLLSVIRQSSNYNINYKLFNRYDQRQHEVTAMFIFSPKYMIVKDHQIKRYKYDLH
jgi:hypothetical protein